MKNSSLLCRTWCVHRCCLSVGFISPYLVYAAPGSSIPQLACLFSSPHLLRVHVQPQMNFVDFDIVTLRYVLRCSLLRTFCHTCGVWIPQMAGTYLLAPGRASVTCPWAVVYGCLFSNIAPIMQLCYPRPEYK